MIKNTEINLPSVLWLQVWALAAVQGAITLCWVVYDAYIPQLLGQFGFSLALAGSLLIIENLLGSVMEPVMGGLSDRGKRWMGSRFPFISAGVILASALFLLIPAVFIFGGSSEEMSWTFIGVIIAWTVAMNVFRSPVIVLLGQYAAPKELPLAASLLTLVGGTIGAFRFLSNRLLLSLPPVVVFAIASFILLGAAFVLRSLHPPEVPTPEDTPPPPETSLTTLITTLGLILGTGASVAWGSRFLMDTVRRGMISQFGTANLDWVMFVVSIALACAALPAGALAVRWGNRRAMLLGIGTAAGTMILIAAIPTLAVFSIIVLIGALSLVLNGAIPYVLTLIPSRWGGLGIGMYFGGLGAASSLFGLVFGKAETASTSTAVIIGVLALGVAAICIILSLKVVPTLEKTSPTPESV